MIPCYLAKICLRDDTLHLLRSSEKLKTKWFEKKPFQIRTFEIYISFSPNYSEINWAIVGLKEKNLLALAFARGRTSTEPWKKVKTFTFRLRCQTEPE